MIIVCMNYSETNALVAEKFEDLQFWKFYRIETHVHVYMCVNIYVWWGLALPCQIG